MAEDTWGRLTEAERKRAAVYHVGLYNLDKAGNYMEQEDGSIDADGRTVIYDRLNELTENRIEDILKVSGMKMADFSRAFGVPYRSLQNWLNGSRKAPDYVLDMLEKIVWEYREGVTRGVTL